MTGIIFDLDGTLIDSMEFWHNIPYIAAKQYETGKLDEGLIKSIESMTVGEAITTIINRLKLDISEEEFKKNILRLIREQYMEGFQLKKGVKDFIKQAKNQGIKLCIATTTDLKPSEIVTKRLDIFEPLEFIQSQNEVNIKKKDPEFYIHAMNNLGTTKENTWVFEDALYAAKSAKAAGFKVVGVIDKAYRPEEIQEIKNLVDIYIEDFTEIKPEELKNGK